MSTISKLERKNVLGKLIPKLTDKSAADKINGIVEVINDHFDKGTVTQTTAITTAVTLNSPAGVITTVSTTVAAGSNASFTVNNSYCTASSVVMLTVDDSATAGLAKLNVQSVAAGSFVINITNVHGANAFNNVIKIHFAII